MCWHYQMLSKLVCDNPIAIIVAEGITMLGSDDAVGSKSCIAQKGFKIYKKLWGLFNAIVLNASKNWPHSEPNFSFLS